MRNNGALLCVHTIATWDRVNRFNGYAFHLNAMPNGSKYANINDSLNVGEFSPPGSIQFGLRLASNATERNVRMGSEE